LKNAVTPLRFVGSARLKKSKSAVPQSKRRARSSKREKKKKCREILRHEKNDAKFCVTNAFAIF
jgi:hypothetical protein